MSTILQSRQAQLDREIAEKRAEYERTLARVRSDAYREDMLLALARVADILDAPRADRPDFQALVMIGRIGEITRRFAVDQRTIDEYEGKKQQRQKLDVQP